MTEQCAKAMLALYAKEAKTNDNVEKAIIDEALDQVLRQTDSELPVPWIVSNALSNARKKVSRYHNRNFELDEDRHPISVEPDFGVIELTDILTRTKLSPRQCLILCRCGQGYSIQEIAHECEISPKNVYRSRFKARAVIQKNLSIEFLKKTS